MKYTRQYAILIPLALMLFAQTVDAFYNPATGKWLSRDPEQENGGLALYSFTENGPVDGIDYLGRALYAFDGTANVPSDETNVSILEEHGYTGQNHRYLRGIGNEEEHSKIIAILLQATGWELGAKRSAMLQTMARFIRAGDIDVDVIGFSRGAVTAASFTRAVQKLKEKGVDPFCRVKQIRFLGLFDPVPGPLIVDSLEIPSLVKNTSIAYSFDEQRSAFSPSLYTGSGISRVLFRGGHSDVGGGYPDRGLANISVEWMVRQGMAAGGPFVNPKTSKGTTMIRHQESAWYSGYGSRQFRGIPFHASVSRLVRKLEHPVLPTRPGQSTPVSFEPSIFYLDYPGPGRDQYRIGDNKF